MLFLVARRMNAFYLGAQKRGCKVLGIFFFFNVSLENMSITFLFLKIFLS